MFVMSRELERSQYSPEEFDLGDRVIFVAPWGDPVEGVVVRVYNSGDLYHVEVEGKRYEVDQSGDQMRRA
jgi:hypothetical protein